MMSPATYVFPFAFEDRYVAPARVFGVTPASTSIVVEAGHLRADFGPWHIATPLTNITAVRITGPYSFLKTAGPAHLGVTDLGLTFATNSRQGVLLELRDRIRGIDPLGVIRHGNLTLTPQDCAGLASALR